MRAEAGGLALCCSSAAQVHPAYIHRGATAAHGCILAFPRFLMTLFVFKLSPLIAGSNVRAEILSADCLNNTGVRIDGAVGQPPRLRHAIATVATLFPSGSEEGGRSGRHPPHTEDQPCVKRRRSDRAHQDLPQTSLATQGNSSAFLQERCTEEKSTVMQHGGRLRVKENGVSVHQIDRRPEEKAGLRVRRNPEVESSEAARPGAGVSPPPCGYRQSLHTALLGGSTRGEGTGVTSGQSQVGPPSQVEDQDTAREPARGAFGPIKGATTPLWKSADFEAIRLQVIRLEQDDFAQKLGRSPGLKHLICSVGDPRSESVINSGASLLCRPPGGPAQEATVKLRSAPANLQADPRSPPPPVLCSPAEGQYLTPPESRLEHLLPWQRGVTSRPVCPSDERPRPLKPRSGVSRGFLHVVPGKSRAPPLQLNATVEYGRNEKKINISDLRTRHNFIITISSLRLLKTLGTGTLQAEVGGEDCDLSITRPDTSEVATENRAYTIDRSKPSPPT
ncbi:hypothetical protein Bbelb_104570 [Branchiostoma belcheri]|nr:hypothetical protein Bbelb_104570 [Branchiostoma belcheri]